MKQFSLFFLISILASCGTFHTKVGHLRYVKVATKEVAVIEKSNSKDPSKIKEEYLEVGTEKKEILFQAATSDLIDNEEILLSENKYQDIKIEQKSTSRHIKDAGDDDEIVAQAIRTEKKASAAMFLSITGILTIIPYLGILPLLVGFIFYIIANSSRYITPFGEKRLKVAKTFLIIDSIILLLWVIFIVAILLLW
jgi:hypothetical protein